MTIEQLEAELMSALLAGEDTMLAALRTQYRVATFSGREFTGVGLFTHFSLPADVPLVTPSDFTIDDVFLQLQGVEVGALAMLFVRDGRIDWLEVVIFGEGSWPDSLVLQSLDYLSPHHLPSKVRDLDALPDHWNPRKGNLPAE